MRWQRGQGGRSRRHALRAAAHEATHPPVRRGLFGSDWSADGLRDDVPEPPPADERSRRGWSTMCRSDSSTLASLADAKRFTAGSEAAGSSVSMSIAKTPDSSSAALLRGSSSAAAAATAPRCCRGGRPRPPLGMGMAVEEESAAPRSREGRLTFDPRLVGTDDIGREVYGWLCLVGAQYSLYRVMKNPRNGLARTNRIVNCMMWGWNESRIERARAELGMHAFRPGRWSSTNFRCAVQFGPSVAGLSAMVRSLCGVPLPESKRQNAPSYRFGTEAARPTDVGGASSRVMRLSPGPIYNPALMMSEGPKITIAGLPSAPGTRRAGAVPGPGEYDPSATSGSRSKTQPAYSWGAAPERPQTRGSCMPTCGPDRFYEVRESIGPQATRKNPPAYSLLREPRFARTAGAQHRRSAASPGPGSYRHNASLGPQAVSTLRSGPAPSFGTSSRFGRAATANSGPRGSSSYQARSAVGPQVTSEKRTGSAFGFGSSRRFPDHSGGGPGGRPASAREGGTPGPGSYNA